MHIKPAVNLKQNEFLEREITEQGVKEAIQLLEEKISPEIDGLPIEFYKTKWADFKFEITF